MNQIELFESKTRRSVAPSKQTLPFKRVRDEEWDFRDIQASSYVYGIHPYPAMFHFRVVRKLLQDYSDEGDLILDPFLGSGVTAVECLTARRRFIGYDINPLALMIARVRCAPLKKADLLETALQTESTYSQKKSVPVDFHNIRYWFEEDVIDELSKLRQSIFEISDEEILAFFKVVFSEVVRRVSRTSYNEFKLLRQKREPKPVNVGKTFREVSLRNISLLTDFYHNRPSLLGGGTFRNENILHSDLKNGFVDLVITSPPYGDSRTTVAYGQFSRLSLRWLGLEEVVDRTSLGSKAQEITPHLPSPLLYEYLEKISAKDVKRAKEVFSFYNDLVASVQLLAKAVKTGGRVCFVVGNRTVKGEQLPTDKISADFFESVGFQHKQTFVRAISNKRMPTENSPSNTKGIKDSTMRFEYIVMLQKLP
ncbi:site-specific DNA-methyltransferase [bacterium]|nr:site-specific DNA-methyltransferase [bacterium]